MGYPHYDLVERAYNELKAEGKIPMGNVEHDKGLITQRSGYYSYQRDSTMGVLEKTSGNNYLGYSVDILIRTNGQYYDIVTDKNGEAVPVNGGPSTDPELIPRWRKPSAELAQVEEGGGGGTPEPEPEPEPPATVDLQPVLDAVAASEANVKAHVTAETERVMQRLADYRQEVIDFAEQAGVLLILRKLAQGDNDTNFPELPSKPGKKK